MDDIARLNRDIGDRLRAMRQARGLTLDALASRTGVSRAMLSRIERGDSSPTAQLLARISAGFDVTLSALFAETEPAAAPLRRRAEQVVWRDPESGYTRHAVSPPGTGATAEIIDVDFPAGATVAFEAQQLADADQQVFVLAGTMEMSVGANSYRLAAGDCLHMRFGEPIRFRNPSPDPARYIVVVSRRTARP